MSIQQVTVVEILPTRIWIESDIFGSRHVMLQHEGMESFAYASFHYQYGYTDNSSTWAAAEELATALGAVKPVEHRSSPVPAAWQMAADGAAEYASWTAAPLPEKAKQIQEDE